MSIKYMESTRPNTSTTRSVESTSMPFDTTILAPDFSWISLIFDPALPITEPISWCATSSLMDVVVGTGGGVFGL